MAKKVGFYSIFIVLIMTQNFHQSSLCADVVWPKITQKCQKPEAVDFGNTRCGFSQKSPNLDYFGVIFGVFEQFLAKPHLVARQNKTIWTFGKNMSGGFPKSHFFADFSSPVSYTHLTLPTKA